MKRLLLLLLIPLATAAQEGPRVIVGPDERTELMSVIMHLAGAGEYDQQKIWPKYEALVDSLFDPYRDHPVMGIVRDMRDFENYIMAFNEPMDIALNGYIENGRVHSTYYPKAYNWDEEKHDELIAAINDFYRDTDFHKFYTEQALPVYLPIQQKWEEGFNSIIDLGWIDRYVGEKVVSVDIVVTLSILLGPVNLGNALFHDNTPRPVMGVTAEVTDWEDPMLLLHELFHIYLDPIVDKYKDELAPSGEIIFPLIRKQTGVYNRWQSILWETVNNASVIVYMSDHGLPYEKQIALDEKAFCWIEELADLLGEYQKQRDKYPTLESFMPEVVKFYNDLAIEQ